MTRAADAPAAAARPAEPGRTKTRVCFVLSYRAPDYIRGRSLCAALASMPDVELVPVINRTRGPGRYLETIRGLIRIRKQLDPDIYLLGFRGHEIAWLVRWLTRGKPLVVDAMMSPYAALAEEGKAGLAGRLLAPAWRILEKAMLVRADAILTDTRLHARYYSDTFGIDMARLTALPVGAIERDDATRPGNPEPATRSFRVLFYGSFLPLHGIDVILDAAARLADLPIEFRFIGGSASQATRLHAACAGHGIRNYSHAPWSPMERLLDDEIPGADLCLGGPFGGTPQARRVVTGKASQCLALGKATVIGRIDEDYGLIDKVNCLLVDQGDADALASAIGWAYANRARLPAIGAAGRAQYDSQLSVRRIAARLAPLIGRLAR